MITNNDPLLNPDTVTAILTVVGAPELDVSATCLDLDSISEYTSSIDSFYVKNIGCDTLFVTNITNALSEYKYLDLPSKRHVMVYPTDRLGK